jgi:hypothetical protein
MRWRLEQNASPVAAIARSSPSAELGPEHFDREELRRLREQLLSGAEPEGDRGLLAELDARATSEGIDERSGAVAAETPGRQSAAS